LLGGVLAGRGTFGLVRSLDARQSLLLLGLAVVASAAHVRMVVGPTRQSSYNLGLVVYSFTLATLGAESAVVVALAASLVEWAWHRYSWFTQAFNIGCLAIALSLSGLVHDLVLGSRPPSGPVGALALVAAVVVFLVVNHLMVGIVIRLSRGESFGESGVFGRLTLVIDGTLLAMGVSAALLWQVNPSVFLIAVAPLYLIAVTLRVPALERQAATDPKTGLFNTRYFREALERELSRANRFDRPLTVVVGDLDLLRNVNNLYGHLAGDDVLVAVAEILKTSVRDYDVVARFGGEEFTILMPEVPLAEAVPRVEAIRAAIAAREVVVSGSATTIRMTMSFGLSERLVSGDTPHDLLHRADIAVYRAKLEGRNRVCVIRTEDAAWDEDFQMERAKSYDVHADDVGPMPVRDRLATSEHGGSPSHAGVAQGTSVLDAPTEEAMAEDGLRVSSREPRAPDARSTLRLHLLVGFVTLAALGFLAFSLRDFALPDLGLADPMGLLLFALICILAESLAMDIYVRETSVSTSAAPFVAGVLLFGPVGGFVLGVVLAGAAMLKHHSPFSRFLFNASVHVLTGLARQASGFRAWENDRVG
jgi:diguanylate cyclase (GGDEF)-like protein